MNFDGEDPPQRQLAVPDTDVGRRDAKLPSQLPPGDDAAVHRIRTAQQAGGIGHAAFGQGRSNGGTGNAQAVDQLAIHGFDLEAVASSGSAQHRLVSLPSRPKTEVITNQQMLDLQAAHQQALDEFLGR